MSLRIACDLDGTIADMETALQREAECLFGMDVDVRATLRPRSDDVPPSDVIDPTVDDATEAALDEFASEAPTATGVRRPLTREELRRLWKHVGKVESFWSSLTEIEPGAVARFGTLAQQHRWEVLFLTQRPPCDGDTTQRQTQRWLQQHGFDLPSVMVMRGSRGRVADALSLDVVLDDRPENCLDVTLDSSAKPILIWRDQGAAPPVGLAKSPCEIVRSVGDALDHLQRLSAGRAPGNPTLLGRLRNAFRV